MTEAKIIKTIARQIWLERCADAAEEHTLNKLPGLPTEWSNPWSPSTEGGMRAQRYEARARLILDAISEYVNIKPDSST